MAFIGIVAESKNEMGIKRILESKLNSPTKEHTIIVINDKSAENIRNIKFQAILVMTLDEITDKKEIVYKIFNNAEYLVMNADVNLGSFKLIDKEVKIITFGFKQRATITASSVEENLMVYLQREIEDVNKKVIEPQEILIKTADSKLENNAHNAMGIGTILLIYGKNEINF